MEQYLIICWVTGGLRYLYHASIIRAFGAKTLNHCLNAMLGVRLTTFKVGCIATINEVKFHLMIFCL